MRYFGASEIEKEDVLPHTPKLNYFCDADKFLLACIVKSFLKIP